MKHHWRSILAVACGILLSLAAFFIMLLNAVEAVAFDTARYEAAYVEYDRAAFIGISQEELMDVTRGMLDYLRGRQPALDMQATIKGETRPVFGERELMHMQDVRALFKAGYTLKFVMVGVVVLCMAGCWLAGLQKSLRVWPKCWFGVLIAMGALIGAFGLWCALDFNAAFTAFHRLLFTNDLWLLDINTEVLIQMFPEPFFLSLFMAVLGRFGLYLALMSGAAVCAIIWRRKQEALAGGNG